MDRRSSASEAARLLGTNVPRLLRAAERLGLDCRRGRARRIELTGNQVEQLRDRLGIAESIPSLSRVEGQVLAALTRAPRGVFSARAVARRAGVSPTAASRGLTRLVRRGLVRRDRELAALGRVHEVDVYRANVSAPEWASLADGLARVRPPRARRRGTRPRRVPPELRHLFWNTVVSHSVV